LLCRSGVVNCGSIVPAFRYFVIVLRDKPVRRAISRTESFSRKDIRRIIFKSPMCITPLLPICASRSGESVTWLKSQWKLSVYPTPTHIIAGGMPTEATLAHVLVSKYADHLPLYRQAQIYSRQGIDLDRSTLAAWVGKSAFELIPV
jgi:hypothetical protein